MDSVEWLTMAIMDKGYYDYDYQYVEPKREILTVEQTAKSDEQLSGILARFGIGRASQETKCASQEPKGAEALQKAVIRDLEEREGNSLKAKAKGETI